MRDNPGGADSGADATPLTNSPGKGALGPDSGSAADADADAALTLGEVVRVPAGTFTLLASTGKGPLMRLTHGFYADRFEVTVAQYKDWVVAGRPSPCPGMECTLDPGSAYTDTMTWDPKDDEALGERTCDGSPNTYDGSDDRAPINCVSWPQAVAVCHYRGMRLLTNVEWQYIASGRGQSRTYPWGDAPAPNDCSQAIWGMDGFCGFPKPVGSASGDVSRDGVRDLGGSVGEWVYDDSWPADLQVTTPDDFVLAKRPRPSLYGYRQVRGGDYASEADKLRTWHGTFAEARLGSSKVGFRCAKTEVF